ncbi:MAG: DUF2523 domain-containing protein [Curvibacter lanceolatus]|uniref:DUF2523 family protein n=1 Tax=Curvibacter lanceolatus TaxID=86182 RepID=UPI002357D0D5|nr:DUF2523 family protein [Curvibacter lanceolatus]MBV5292540.1 DUF2523 domain-containing protein [Curvibacter lanceolatus]
MYKLYIRFTLFLLLLPAWAMAQTDASGTGTDTTGTGSSSSDSSLASTLILGLLKPLFNALASIAKWEWDIVKKSGSTLMDILKDWACWCLDQLLGLVEAALGAIDVSAFDGLGNLTGMIPATVMQVLSAIGVGQALGMILAAIGIRFALQLIPFVRLGS